MKKNFPIIVEQDEDGVFIVECPALKGCRSYGYTTIPDHGSRDVPKGLLVKIIRYDLEMQTDEFEEILK